MACRAQWLAHGPLFEEVLTVLGPFEVADIKSFCLGHSVVKFNSAKLAQGSFTHPTVVVVKRKLSDVQVQLALAVVFGG